MAKEAYYFSHDANARQDPKVLEMMSVYGLEGYGRYWVLVEMLREQSNFTLKLSGKYSFDALAMQMQCKADAAEEFVHDCVNEFGLFESDGELFWSNSLIRRMAIKEEISHKRKKAAEARWGKSADKTASSDEANANSMQMHSKSNANGMQGKEKKVKESKGKEKTKYAEFVSMTEEEHQKLVDAHGQEAVAEMVLILDNYKGSKNKKYASDYRAILSWVIDRHKEKNKSSSTGPVRFEDLAE